MNTFTILSRYIFRQFFLYFIIVLAILSSIILLFEFIEMVRRVGGRPEATIGIAIQLTLLKSPQTIGLLLHFTVLFSAMLTFWQLTRNHELVVVRAAGISVWKFMQPVLLGGAVVGVVHISIINPLGAFLYTQFETIANHYIRRLDSVLDIAQNGLWLRQHDTSGISVIFAQRISQNGLMLFGVTIYKFDEANHYISRVDAESALLCNGYWDLHDVWIIDPPGPRYHLDQHQISSDLNFEHIKNSLSSPSRLSFWELPGFISKLESLGFSSLRYRLQYQSLIAQPLLLVSMTLFAAAFSLRMPRQGGQFLLLVVGASIGFILFIMIDILKVLGLTEKIPAALAAWTPSIISMLIGCSLVLHLEDG
jgi:lipopolysaccharide export system permease protein